MKLLQNMTLAFRRHRYLQDALDVLNSHSDRELSDMGLRRGDVVDLARAMAEERLAAYTARRATAPAVSGYVSALQPAS